MQKFDVENGLFKPVLKGTVLFFMLLGSFFYSVDGGCRKVRTVHVVKPGESVAKIADFYGVAQRDLIELNHLKKKTRVKPGQKLKIPNVLRVTGRQYTVKEGDSLASIARKFHSGARDIARANKINGHAALKPGRIIVIPGKQGSGKYIKLNGKVPRPIVFLRVRTGEREKLRLYSKNGKVIYKSVKILSHISRDKKGNQPEKRLNYGLIEILQRLAWRFAGKPIEIISGYRAQSTGAESQHAFGRAMDLRIPGVSCKKIFNFCKTLPSSGCGYYPNSGFVHMDIREKRVRWVDTSP
jgi:uncharacterized protein YcbK (DUF882 family)